MVLLLLEQELRRPKNLVGRIYPLPMWFVLTGWQKNNGTARQMKENVCSPFSTGSLNFFDSLQITDYPF